MGVPRRPQQPTAYGALVLAAMACKAAETPPDHDGRRRGYTYRDLGAASGVDAGAVQHQVFGRRRPTRATVERVVRALAPYLDRDAALIAAGFTPQEGTLSRLIARLSALPGSALDQIEGEIERRYWPPSTEGHAGGQPEQPHQHHIGQDGAHEQTGRPSGDGLHL